MNAPGRTLALVGCGAIGRAVLEGLRDEPGLCVSQVIVPARDLAGAGALCATLAPQARVRESLDLDGGRRPDLLVECAGHAAVRAHVLPALEAGVAVVMVSIGALHDADLLAQVEASASSGNTRVTLVSGAIGGIDALAAARLGGLDSVTYEGRKPATSWSGTPAADGLDLAALREPALIFEGSAREAAQRYPKNANVAATVSLAGLGLDATRVRLIADPGIVCNVHRIVAEGGFGHLDLTLENRPLAANPKTSALTVYSVQRAVRNLFGAVAL